MAMENVSFILKYLLNLIETHTKLHVLVDSKFGFFLSGDVSASRELVKIAADGPE